MAATTTAKQWKLAREQELRLDVSDTPVTVKVDVKVFFFFELIASFS